MSKRGMEKENIRLRRIIEVYIHSNNLNNPVWELLDEDEHSKGPDGGSNGVVSADGDDLLGMQSDSKELLGFRKQVQRDSGENPLRILNRLDIEMNEILANTLREENRQRLLMQDISKLIERHHNFFSSMGKDETDTNAGEGKVQNSQSDKSKSIIKSDETLKKLGFVEHKEFCTAGMQTDEKDEFGLVDNLPQNPILENLGPPPLPPINAKLPGENYPFQLRKVMSSFPFVLRVPPGKYYFYVFFHVIDMINKV